MSVARTFQQQKQGLMHKKKLAANAGMLFEYSEKKILNFWMKNTLIPLSIAFIDPSGRINEILDMEPQDEQSVQSKHPSKYALEVNKGWFQENNISVGDKVSGLNLKKINIYIQ